MHAQIHLHVHMYRCVCASMYVRTYIHTYMPTCARTYIDMYIYTYISHTSHMYLSYISHTSHIHLHTHTCACTCTCTPRVEYARVCTCKNMYLLHSLQFREGGRGIDGDRERHTMSYVDICDRYTHEYVLTMCMCVYM